MLSPPWRQQQQQRRLLTPRRSNVVGRRGVVLVPATTTSLLSAVLLFAIFLLSWILCMINWWQSFPLLHSLVPDPDNNTFETPRRLPIDIGEGKANGKNNSSRNQSFHDDDDGSSSSSSSFRLDEEGVPKTGSNEVEYSSRGSSLRNIKLVDLNSRLPETKDYLMTMTRLSSSTSSSSSIDFGDLAIRLANKSVNVYRPGSWDGAGIVIEEFQLVFFTQGKVACTVFKKLFRRMMHLNNWNVENANLPHNPQTNGLTYLYHYNIADALTILTHPDWTRAMFVRDPKERILSAYLDKAARKNGIYVTKHCCPHEQKKKKKNATTTSASLLSCGEEAASSFLGFLNVVQTRCCCDPHWISQTKRIDQPFQPFINFIGHFETIQQDTKRLLKSLQRQRQRRYDSNDNNNYGYGDGIYDMDDDLWTMFGASGWGKFGNESIFSKDTKAKHQTSAITKLQLYYNTTSEALVEKLYAADYNEPLFNLTTKK